MDGGLEEDGTRRDLLAVTPAEPQGHIVREKAAAEFEQRGERRAFRQVPLTGAHQSMLPTYRLARTFGQIQLLDEHGLCDPTDQRVHNTAERVDSSVPFIVDTSGEVIGFQMPDGQEATEEQICEDAVRFATCFARDARACQVQNHDHNCTTTCYKYKQKRQRNTEKHARGATKPAAQDGSTNAVATASEPAAPPLQCRFRFFRIIVQQVQKAVRHILRRGKALVATPFIQEANNEQNECGRVMVVRRHPFRSASSDVLQCAVRSNADVQYCVRVCPSLESPAASEPALRKIGQEQDNAAEVMPPVFFVWRTLQVKAKKLLSSFAVAMRAAPLADFYMTKYQAKSQQALSSAIGPLVQGLQRIEEEEGEEDTPLADMARKKLRRLMFAANRCHWFSACELALVIDTGAAYLATHKHTPMFISRTVAMMHQCKRLLNNEVLNEGLLVAACASKADSVPAQTFRVVLRNRAAEVASNAPEPAVSEPPTQEVRSGAAAEPTGVRPGEPPEHNVPSSAPEPAASATEMRSDGLAQPPSEQVGIGDASEPTGGEVHGNAPSEPTAASTSTAAEEAGNEESLEEKAQMVLFFF